MIAVAALAGYLIGSIPTADWLARLAGHDLRNSGTGNPGTANALGLAGPRVAMTILAIDAAKGAAAVLLGRVVAGDAGGLVAGFAAIAGQILNPWFRFRGGKGLGVSLGVVSMLFPFAVMILAPVIVIASRMLRSVAKGALVALAGFLIVGVVWWAADLPNLWGVRAGWQLATFTAAAAALIAPKFAMDVREAAAARPVAQAPAP